MNNNQLLDLLASLSTDHKVSVGVLRNDAIEETAGRTSAYVVGNDLAFSVEVDAPGEDYSLVYNLRLTVKS